MVNEGLEIAKSEEVIPESPATDAPEALQASPPQAPSWLRLAYSFEFLIALLIVFTVWSEVGGQSHLDMMPWYIKLSCGLAMAWCSIRFTAGLVEEQKVWNRRSGRWFIGLLLIATMMAGITYYYHLQETQDEQDGDDTTATSVKVAAPAGGFSRTSDRTIR